MSYTLCWPNSNITWFPSPLKRLKYLIKHLWNQNPVLDMWEIGHWLTHYCSKRSSSTKSHFKIFNDFLEWDRKTCSLAIITNQSNQLLGEWFKFTWKLPGFYFFLETFHAMFLKWCTRIWKDFWRVPLLHAKRIAKYFLTLLHKTIDGLNLSALAKISFHDWSVSLS